MTIQEAIKSGKPFKFPEDIEWNVYDDETGFRYLHDDGSLGTEFFIGGTGILREDWEVKE